MKLNDLEDFIFDKVFIYRSSVDEDGFICVYIYKGFLQNAPENILNKTICSVGAKRKGIVDICVED